MDQIKIGGFMKELRKEKGCTQEQLAERFNVNRRTVSRWETGSNLPDLDILIEMADYYGVGLRELLDGKRRKGDENEDPEETVLKVVEYSNEDKQRKIRHIHVLCVCGMVAAVIYMMLILVEYTDSLVGGLCLGIQFGLIILGAILTGKNADKIRTCKMRSWRFSMNLSGRQRKLLIVFGIVGIIVLTVIVLNVSYRGGYAVGRFIGNLQINMRK